MNTDIDIEPKDGMGLYPVVSRGGRCSLFLTMRCFSDAMFSNS